MIDVLAQALIGIGKIGSQANQLESCSLETADRGSKRVAPLDLVLGKVEDLLRRGDRMKRGGQAFLRQSERGTAVAGAGLAERFRLA